MSVRGGKPPTRPRVRVTPVPRGTARSASPRSHERRSIMQRLVIAACTRRVCPFPAVVAARVVVRIPPVFVRAFAGGWRVKMAALDPANPPPGKRTVWELAITNAGVYIKDTKLQRILEEAGVKGIHKVVKVVTQISGFVHFLSEAERAAAAETIAKVEIKGRVMAVAFNPPRFQAISGGGSGGGSSGADGTSTSGVKRPRPVAPAATPMDDATAARAAAAVVAPWHDVDYAEQLARKQAAMHGVLRAVTLKTREHIWRAVPIKKRALRMLVSGRLRRVDDDSAAPAAASSAADAATAIATAADDSAADADATAPASKRARLDGDDAAAAAAGAPAEADEDADAGDAGEAEGGAAAGAAAARGGAKGYSKVPSPEELIQPPPRGHFFMDTLTAQLTPPSLPPAGLTPEHIAMLPDWLKRVPADLSMQAAPVLRIVPSPVRTGYRNKIELTIGRDSHGVARAGHRLSGFAEGTQVVPVHESLPNAPRASLALAAIIDEFVRTSPLPPYDMGAHTGVWRTVMIRWCVSTGESMVALQAQPVTSPRSGLLAAASSAAATSSSDGAAADATSAGTDAAPAAPGSLPTTAEALEAIFKAEIARFVRMMRPEPAAATAAGADDASAAGDALSSAAAGTPLSVTSVYLQEFDGVSNPPPNHPFTLLEGAPDVVERVVVTRPADEAMAVASASAVAPASSAAADSLQLVAAAGSSAAGTSSTLSFRISPGAFFQVNTPATERLFDVVRALAVHGAAGAGVAGVYAAHGLTAGGDDLATAAADASSASSAAGGAAASSTSLALQPGGFSPTAAADNAALIDVCCGTGVIGLYCARHFKRVVGVELSAPAIEDAKRNATLNGINNAVFVCGKAEDAMKQILAIASGSASGDSAAAAAGDASDVAPSSATATTAIRSVVAVVDPPRGGLHPSVIRALRTCKPITRLVYVSCNPTGSFVEDAMKLCAPSEKGKSSTFAAGPPFRPVLSIPLDLFPDTPHTELITLFEREDTAAAGRS